jgi:hypothetical protein
VGTVFRKAVTRALPSSAEVFTRDGERFARWKHRSGRTRTAPVTPSADGSPRILVRASTYTAKYRDATGRIVERPTGCRDEGAARALLVELEKRSELVKANVLTSAQDAVASTRARRSASTSRRTSRIRHRGTSTARGSSPRASASRESPGTAAS